MKLSKNLFLYMILLSLFVSLAACENLEEENSAVGDVETESEAGLSKSRERTLALCSDGIDNDGDDKIDCADNGCSRLKQCRIAENSFDACTDGIDNDADGDMDCADRGCRGVGHCLARERSLSSCTDGFDNDGDHKTDCEEVDCAQYCAERPIRVTTHNVYRIRDIGSEEYKALVKMINRINSDVYCFEEVGTKEWDRLESIAAETNYDYVFMGDRSSKLGGYIVNACISRYPIVDYGSYTGNTISDDSRAHDVSRDFVHIRIEIEAFQKYMHIITLHWKSGHNRDQQYQRQIEAIRTAQLVKQLEDKFPGEPIVVMGDLNEYVYGPELDNISWDKQSPDVRDVYVTGDDINFPVVYNPFKPLMEDSEMQLVDATWEDTTNYFATRIPSWRRIDYIFYKGMELRASEVYEACNDDGVDDGIGVKLPKRGEPLPCGINSVASDHRPVIAEFDF